MNSFNVSNSLFKMFWPVTAVAVLVISIEVVSAQQPSDIEENRKIEAQNSCKCVRYYLCQENNEVDVYGETVLKPRINLPKIPCKGGSFPNEILCCKLNDSITTTQEPDDRNPSGEVTLDPPKPSSCGKIRTAVITRVLNTDDDLAAIDGEFPWMVAIFNRTSQFHCGGTLIHRKVVLTAYHCVYRKRPRDFTIRATGKVNFPNEDKATKHVSEIIGHPRYAHAGRLYNDAALLILDTPLDGDNLNTLCLPPDNLDLEGVKCIVAGWGKGRSQQPREKLKRVELPFVNRNRCQNLMRNTRLGPNFDLHSSFMCAGGEEGRDACIGDGGGALLCEMPSDPDQFFQAGIVSWGIECGLRDVPGVYTDVERISEWIADELRTRRLTI